MSLHGEADSVTEKWRYVPVTWAAAQLVLDVGVPAGTKADGGCGGDSLRGRNRPTERFVRMKAVLLPTVVKISLVFAYSSLVSVLHCRSTAVVSHLAFCLS